MTEEVSERLKKIAEHLVFLEKKLDTLIEQGRNRRSFNSGYVKPFQRPYDGNRQPARHPFGGGDPRAGYSGRSSHSSGNRYEGPRRPDTHRCSARTRTRFSPRPGNWASPR